MTSYSSASIWLLMIVTAAGTWMLRVSFIALLGAVSTIPESVRRVLKLIPAAVLAALVAPALTHAGGTFDLSNPRFAAGVVAAFVAWRSGHVLATIGAGMGTLWILQALGWG